MYVLIALSASAMPILVMARRSAGAKSRSEVPGSGAEGKIWYRNCVIGYAFLASTMRSSELGEEAHEEDEKDSEGFEEEEEEVATIC